MSQNTGENRREQFYEALTIFVEDARRDRKTRKFRFALVILILGILASSFLLALYEQYRGSFGSEYVAVVKMEGEIGSSSRVSAGLFAKPLTDAFRDPRAKGVVLVINSRGGQPAQSQLIHDQIARLSAENNKRVLVVCEDFCASGAFLVAVVGEKIYAPTTSMIGSIGVVVSSFSVYDLAQRFGIKNRTITAGEFKDPLNPLSPDNPEAEARVRATLKEVHEEFIRIVKAGRGERLKAGDVDLFTGEAWSGKRAHDLGLIDGHLDLYGVVKQEFGLEAVRPYQPQLGVMNLLGMLPGG